ncbi:MAG: hypothetical protein ABR593_09495, partial [Candidatus Limnocylindria bacterium]
GGLMASGALFIGAFWQPTQAAALLLPFVIMYVGFHAANLSTIYVPVVIGWALLNGAYLAWYFLARRDQRVVEAILADAHEPRQSDAA